MTVLVEGNGWSKPKYRNRKIQKHSKCLVAHCAFFSEDTHTQNPPKTNKTDPNPPKKPQQKHPLLPKLWSQFKKSIWKIFELVKKSVKKVCTKKLLKKLIFLFYYNCKTCSWQRSGSSMKGHCWWNEITTELPKCCPGHRNHSLVKVAPEGMGEMLRGSLTCVWTQCNFTYYRQRIQIICNQYGFSHLHMFLSLLGLCFKRCNKNLREQNWADAEIHCIVSAKSIMDLELHRSILTSIHILHLLFRKAAVPAISPPANFKYVSIIWNHTVGTAGLNSFRAKTKSTKYFKVCKMHKQHSKY